MTEYEWHTSDNPPEMLDFLSGRPGAAYQGPGGVKLDRPSGRKTRLFACACVRQVWHLLDHPHFRACVEAGERYAEGGMTEAELAQLTVREWGEVPPTTGDVQIARNEALSCAISDDWNAAKCVGRRLHLFEATKKCALLRDIFGSPFRPVRLAPQEPECVFKALDVLALEAARQPRPTYLKRSWLTPSVLDLAQGAYANRSMDNQGHLDPFRLALLADALEEAGCDNLDILRHLRGACEFPGCMHGWILRTDGRLGADPCRRCRDVEGKPIVPVHVRGCWAVDVLLGKG